MMTFRSTTEESSSKKKTEGLDNNEIKESLNSLET